MRYLIVLVLLSLLIGLVPDTGGAAPRGRGKAPLLIAGKHEVTIPAGRFAAFCWDPDRQAFREEQVPESPPAVGFDAARAIGRAPSWLRDPLRRQLRRLERVPVRGNREAKVRFLDVTGDDRPDLLVGTLAFAAPDWRLLDAEAPEEEGKAWGDVDRDGLPDLVRVDDEGVVVYRRGRAVSPQGPPAALDFRFGPKLFFPYTAGTAARPAASGDLLLIGDADGGLESYRAHQRAWRPGPTEAGWNLSSKGLFAAPALGDLDGDGEADLVVGREDGTFRCWLTTEGGVENSELLSGLDAGECSTPALGDLDGDGDVDLVSGNRAGVIARFQNMGNSKAPAFKASGYLADIDVGDSSAPTFLSPGPGFPTLLIVGNQTGELAMFNGLEFEPVKGGFGDLDVGEFASPAAAVLSDGKPHLLVGRLKGSLLHYDVHAADGELRIGERDSWTFTPQPGAKGIEEYCRKRYIREEQPVLGANDPETLDAFVSLLAAAPEPFTDEVAFAIAHTPAEVLRAMARLGQAGLLLENAEAIYEMAGKVDYAQIAEKPDHTTLAYASRVESADPVELPRDIYYWWVVHPRLLYEIPCRIDATWWSISAEERGLTDSEWWKHEPETDIRTPSPAGVFWRRGLLTDDRFGKSLFDSVRAAGTLEEALVATHRFLARGSEGGIGLMRFGYETQDIQPWQIYAKHYGSCGEHSIIGAACARTVLIPTSITGCRGEDHVWNEWWGTDGQWHHMDCCGKGNIDRPWGSTEGREHQGKTVSTVTRWWGDDRLDATTSTVSYDPASNYTTGGAGYTDVADVTVRVLDPNDRCVDGALVVVRSHWDNRNMITVWGYTDGDGAVRFGLGYEPNGGYTIEAFTPLGSTGIMNFPVVENEAYELVLRTPRAMPSLTGAHLIAEASPGVTEPTDTAAATIRRSVIHAPNLVTGQRYRISSWITKEHDYRGTGSQAMAADPGAGPEVLIFSMPEYRKFLRKARCIPVHRAPLAEDGRLGWKPFQDHEYMVVFANLESLFLEIDVEIEVAGATAIDESPPEIRITSSRNLAVDRGRSVEITGTVTDNVAVERLRLVCSGREAELDVTDSLDRGTGEFRVTFDSGAGGPLPAGLYPLSLLAFDAAGNFQGSDPINLRLHPARVFKDQVIRQDDPDDPLKSCSWIYGPFVLSGEDRFFLADTKGTAEGFDMDMHLYYDKNGNGRVDGTGERIAQSTTPTANERIFRAFPKAGTYWLYCQGWKVEGDHALLDVEVFPEGKPRRVVSNSPAGRLREAPAVLKAEIRATSRAREGSLRISVDGEDVTKEASVEGQSIELSLAERAGSNITHEVSVTFHDLAVGAEVTEKWTYHVDSIPPLLEILRPEALSGAGPKLELEVAALDEGSRVSVAVRRAGGKERKLKPMKGRPGAWSISLSTEGWEPGEHFLLIVARDQVGNERQKVLALIVPPSGK